MSFVDVLNDNNLAQMVTEPTRGENTLDLFITNNESRILKLKTIPGISDHDGIVYVEADISPITFNQKPRKLHLYKRADWDGLHAHMAKFCDTDQNISANQLWNLFKTELNDSIDKFIPSKVVKRRNGLPYVDKKIKHLIKNETLFKHARTDLTGIPSLKHQGQTFSDPTDKANLLNNTFYSAFSYSADSDLPKDTCSP